MRVSAGNTARTALRPDNPATSAGKSLSPSALAASYHHRIDDESVGITERSLLAMPPAVIEQSHVQDACGVYAKPIGIAVVRLATLRGVVVIERPAIPTQRRPIGHAVAVVMTFNLAPAIPVQSAADRRLAIVHRTEPQRPVGSHETVVQTGLRAIRLQRRQQVELTPGGIEAMQSGSDATDQ